MSGEQKQPDPHAAEQEKVTLQAGVIDTASRMTDMVEGVFGGNIRLFSKTDFEGHALNDMIDLVESANPEHLETAGQALWNAKDAIHDAAKELEDHITRVEWEGEAASAFHIWGGNLVQHALDLAAFADTAGTQIMSAATGLASVKKAMPPRDTRLDPKTVDEIPTPMQVEGNKDYAAAVKAEKDRQEAINQMNRLASFYAVSEETLAKQEPPTFEAMPDVGVPKPTARYGVGPGETAESRSDRGGSASVSHGPVHATEERSPAHEVLAPSKSLDDSITQPGRDVGTAIDSVGTLPPQDVAKPVAVTPPSPAGPNATTAGAVPHFATGTVPPSLGGKTGRTSGFGGATGNRTPVSAQGRIGTPSANASGRGITGPMGRSTATGQPGTRGGGTTAGSSPMGRGVSGGTPRTAGGPAIGRAGGVGSTGAARGNGVVGGRPTAGATPGSTGSRVPRGTVVGAEGNTGSRTPVGNIGQRGVIGAPNSTSGARPGQPARPTAANSNGVVGTPKGRTPEGTTGGVPGSRGGVPHGPTGNRRNTKRDDREGERQPKTQRREAPPATD
ncbi:hypothetical protein [Streptomyces cellulosae]|uniref:hypothetical protein n=1 Tax=Streptomyces cellulosae TaxID=1968 RepID=UPI0004C595E3|nr:hypothetical protein [Streptomyces cellulosae]